MHKVQGDNHDPRFELTDQSKIQGPPKPSIYELAKDFNEYLEMDFQELEFIVSPFLPEGGAGIIYGPPGAGKSIFVHQLAFSLAHGRDIFGWTIAKPRSVLLIDGEFPDSALSLRLQLMANEFGNPESGWMSIYTVASLYGSQGRVLDFGSQADRDELLLHLRHLRESPGQRVPEVLLLDNYVTLFRLEDENSNSREAQDILTWFRKLRFLGIAVILVHHCGKDGVKGGPRGASAIQGPMDFIQYIHRPSPSKPRIEIGFYKQRHALAPDGAIAAEIQSNDGNLFIQPTGQIVEAPMPKFLRAVYDAAPKKQKDLAGLLGIGEPQVSKTATRARRERLLLPGQPPRLSVEGKRHIGVVDEV